MERTEDGKVRCHECGKILEPDQVWNYRGRPLCMDDARDFLKRELELGDHDGP